MFWLSIFNNQQDCSQNSPEIQQESEPVLVPVFCLFSLVLYSAFSLKIQMLEKLFCISTRLKRQQEVSNANPERQGSRPWERLTEKIWQASWRNRPLKTKREAGWKVSKGHCGRTDQQWQKSYLTTGPFLKTNFK